MQPSRKLSLSFLKFDQLFIDAFVNFTAAFTLSFGQVIRFIQTGQVQLSFFFILSSFLIFYFLPIF